MVKRKAFIIVIFPIVLLSTRPAIGGCPWCGKDSKDTSQPLRPVTTCGWLKSFSNIEELSSSLRQGMEEMGVEDYAPDAIVPEGINKVSIQIRSVEAQSIIVWCLSKEGKEAGEEMVEDLARSFEEPVPKERVAKFLVDSDGRSRETELAKTLGYLGQAGYGNYVRNNIDIVSLYRQPFKCSLLPQKCLGEAKCEFKRTAHLVFHEMDPIDAAALWVHEAAHLEGCYNDEDYAREKEGDFKKKLTRSVLLHNNHLF